MTAFFYRTSGVRVAILVTVVAAVVGLGMFIGTKPAAAAGEFSNCTTDRSSCDAGLSCRSNPWRNATEGSLPTGVPTSVVDSAVSVICCDTVWGCINENQVKNATGLGNQDPREIAANVINVILGFLGIIAVILILAGGFMWMTAAGNDEKIETAKKIMSAGVVGLIIVLAAFGIAQFVVNALVGATT